MVSRSDDGAVQREFYAPFLRAPAAIAAIGCGGTILACNATYGEILGVEPRDLVGTNFAHCVCPGDLDRDAAELAQPIETGQRIETRSKPIQLLRPDGTTVWVQVQSATFDDGPGDPYELVTITDVSIQVETQQSLDRRDSWFQTILQHQSDIVTVIDYEGIVQYISPNCERLLGFRAEELVGKRGSELIDPEDLERLAAASTAQLNAGTDAKPIEYRQRRRDGTWLWLEATGRGLPAELGIAAVIFSARDISERRCADAAARAAASRFRNAFATSPLGIAFADLNGRFTWVNRALADTLGIPDSTLLTMSLVDFGEGDGDDLAHEFQGMRRLLDGEIESFTSEQRYEHPEGRSIWTRIHFSLARDATGAPTEILAQLEDVTDRKQREMVLTRGALHDPLTGLLNRTGLREHVDLAWAARTVDTPMAILFGDLDGFKHVNDTLGHDAGDEVLVRVARRIQAAVRAGDIVTRWGGDEFVILCPTITSSEDASRIADRIRLALASPFRVRNGLAELGISIGVALDTGQPLPDLLIKDADAAAYRAKNLGRNQVVVA